MKILVILLLFFSSNLSAQDIKFYDYSFDIPGDFKIKKHEFGKDIMFIMNSKDKGVLIVKKILPKDIFFRPKTYKMSDSSMRALLLEIYGKHPTDNKIVNEARSKINPDDLSIYKHDDFVFFRRKLHESTISKTEFNASTPNDEVITFTFTELADEKFMMKTINSLKVN